MPSREVVLQLVLPDATYLSIHFDNDAAEHYPDHPAERHRQAARRPTGCCLAAIGALLLLLGVVLLLKQRARLAAVPVVTIAATQQPASAARVTAAAVTSGEAMSHPDRSCQWASPGITLSCVESGHLPADLHHTPPAAQLCCMVPWTPPGLATCRRLVPVLCQQVSRRRGHAVPSFA